jgi:excinuclease ABC subunit B
MLKIKSNFKPTGDQPKAIKSLTEGIANGLKDQVLLGVTGSGKTFTMASVIEKANRPALIISPNKTLAAQLYQEFRDFFPEASVHYFVSYYDYYQPEAYIPQSDTYIEKDAKINEQLDRLRHEATQAILQRKDVIVIASVSCIYNIGSPEAYEALSLDLFTGKKIKRSELLRHLVFLQYEKNDYEVKAGVFKVKGDSIEIFGAGGDKVIKIEIPDNRIDKITLCEFAHFGITKKEVGEVKKVKIFPAKYWLSSQDTLPLAIENIKSELDERLSFFKKNKRYVEEQRLRERTLNDLEMLEQNGYCHSIENYSRHIEFREAGRSPYTLIDYFRHAYKKDFLIFMDESHIGVPQVRGMSAGDAARKQTLIDFGFRLPSARDNRPLTFDEFDKKRTQTIFVSATPGNFETEISKNTVQQLIRPTGLLDPTIEVRPTKNQINDLIKEVKARVAKKQRVLITTITKRLAEDISQFLEERGIKAAYLHSEIKTLERPDILKKLREGKYDVLVGINLLREGLDLPEVSLVAILDADKEGFLRNATTLIQTMGRASRHTEGHTIMYADKITDSMQFAIKETERRRKIQASYNKEHGRSPEAIIKPIKEDLIGQKEREKYYTEKEIPLNLLLQTSDPKELIKELEKEMKESASVMEFEKAAALRDKIKEIKRKTR